MNYSTVTEQPLQLATRTQMAMLVTRYAWAVERAKGKDVLEVACGSGLGLGWLASAAASVEAGDLDETNCRLAEEACPNVPVRCMDALDLPFPKASFDVLLLFEAIYYLEDARTFFRQARRVLRPGGMLLISTVNSEWSGFNPSPFSTRYFSAAELKDILVAHGFQARLFTAFPDQRDVVALIRRAAVSLHLIPRTMRGKAFLKRSFYGPLEHIPSQLEMRRTRPQALIPIDQEMDLSRYRVLYAEATA